MGSAADQPLNYSVLCQTSHHENCPASSKTCQCPCHRDVAEVFKEIRTIANGAWDNVDLEKNHHENRHDEGEHDDCKFCVQERKSSKSS